MNEISNSILAAIKCVTKSNFNSKIIGLHEPYFKDTEVMKYLKDCINTGWVSSSGNWVNAFEEEICKFTGSKYAVAVTNGTVGLRLALHCVGVKPNDEVIIPPFTFVATANSICHLGASPHFVDIEPDNLSLSSRFLEERLKRIGTKRNGEVYNNVSGRRIAAIMPVHVFGIPADIYEIKKIADNWGLPIIEDSAEALGSRIFQKNQSSYIHCGLIGDLGVISFNGNKIITTGGGGMIITNNKKLAEKCRHLSTTAKKSHKWEFEHDEVGWNDRMPNINAALGIAQLKVINKRIKQKNKLLSLYKESFANFENIELVQDHSKNIKNNWLINLRFLDSNRKAFVLKKKELLNKAHSEGILLRPAWKLLHELPMFTSCSKGNLNIAEDQVPRILSLPSSPQLLNRSS